MSITRHVVNINKSFNKKKLSSDTQIKDIASELNFNTYIHNNS